MTKLTLFANLNLERYSRERSEAMHARRSSGQTSIRVSRSTLEAMRDLVRKVGNVARTKGDTWTIEDPSPDELIEALAKATVRAGHASSGSARHASADRAKAKLEGTREGFELADRKPRKRRPGRASTKRHASTPAKKAKRRGRKRRA